MIVWFVDTSVLVEILEVPGKCQKSAAIQDIYRQREGDGDRFVLPITAVIETGNHIAQARDLRSADRLTAMLRGAVNDNAPFVLNREAWDESFVTELCDGDGVGEAWKYLAAAGRFGAGDLAILVERDRFVARTAYQRHQVQVWTLENELQAFAS